jgi:uncharacterized membrane protein YkoI
MEQLKKTLTVLPIAAGLALAVAACDSGGAEEGTGEDEVSLAEPTQAQTTAGTLVPSPEATDTSGPSDGGTAMAGERDAQAAVEAAVQAVAGAAAFELDYSDDNQSWEVDLIHVDAEWEVTVSPDGSEVLLEQESGAAEPENADALEQAEISMAEAIAAALEEESGNVDEVGLEDEDGQPVWEVEVESGDGSSTDVRIDAMTGDRIQ